MAALRKSVELRGIKLALVHQGQYGALGLTIEDRLLAVLAICPNDQALTHRCGRITDEPTQQARRNIRAKAKRFDKSVIAGRPRDQSSKSKIGKLCAGVGCDGVQNAAVAALDEDVSDRRRDHLALRDGSEMRQTHSRRNSRELEVRQARRKAQNRACNRDVIVIGEASHEAKRRIRNGRNSIRDSAERGGFGLIDKATQDVAEQRNVLSAKAISPADEKIGEPLSHLGELGG